MIVLAIIGIILVLVAVSVISSYNKMINYRLLVENAWSQIDVQMKRRYDLIPNLVEVVKGVMDFEKDTLTKVMEARSRAMQAPDQATRMKAENEISGFTTRLMATWEAYPVLKSNQNAAQLQEELVSTENKIAYARTHYNDITTNYNALVQQFPQNLIASSFGFKSKDFLEIPEGEKAVPKVKLS